MIYCKICSKKIDIKFLTESYGYHWVEEEHCYMCDNCYGYYDGQSIEKLKNEILDYEMDFK